MRTSEVLEMKLKIYLHINWVDNSKFSHFENVISVIIFINESKQ